MGELTGIIPVSLVEAAMNRHPYRLPDLPIGKTKAYQEIREGRLRAVKCGKLTLILPEDYDRWLQSLLPVAVVDRTNDKDGPVEMSSARKRRDMA